SRPLCRHAHETSLGLDPRATRRAPLSGLARGLRPPGQARGKPAAKPYGDHTNTSTSERGRSAMTTDPIAAPTRRKPRNFALLSARAGAAFLTPAGILV